MEIKKLLSKTDQGPFLDINQDGYLQDLGKNIFIVADSFGGSGIAEVALKKTLDAIRDNYQKLTADRDKTLPFFYSHMYLMETNSLINSVLIAHKKLLKANAEKKLEARAGISLTCIIVFEDNMTIMQVGNCSSYVYRENSLSKIFEEDSLFLQGGREKTTGLKSVPSSALGLYPDLYYQIRELKMKKDDRYILFTDGVGNYVTEVDLVSAISHQEYNLREKIDHFIHLANQRGNQDNQTAMIMQF